jgi:transposase
MSPCRSTVRALSGGDFNRGRWVHRTDTEIAQFSGFCIAAVRRVRQQFGERGTLEPRTYLCGRKTLLSEERKQRLHQLLSEQPDATLAELGAGLDRPFRTSTIDLWLRRLGWKFKKNSGRRRTRTSRRRRKKGALA